MGIKRQNTLCVFKVPPAEETPFRKLLAQLCPIEGTHIVLLTIIRLRDAQSLPKEPNDFSNFLGSPCHNFSWLNGQPAARNGEASWVPASTLLHTMSLTWRYTWRRKRAYYLISATVRGMES
jgi:hypothetical protein